MTLKTDRLTLVPFSHSDVCSLHQMWTNPSVRKYLWDDQVVSLEMVKTVVEDSIRSFSDQGWGFWTLQLPGDSNPIGFCGLRTEFLANQSIQSW